MFDIENCILYRNFAKGDSAVKNALRGLENEVQNLRIHGNY